MGRLRWTRTLVHSVVSWVKATAFTIIAALPCVLDASRPPPTTPATTTLLPVPAPREWSRTTQRSSPESPAGSHGAQEGTPRGRCIRSGSPAKPPAPAATVHDLHPLRYAGVWAAQGIATAAAVASATSRARPVTDSLSGATARDLPDGIDEFAQFVRLGDRRLPARLEKMPRFVAGLVARDEDEAVGELGPLVHELLVQRPPAQAWHLQVRHDRVEHGVALAEALNRLDAVLDGHDVVPLPLEQQLHRLAVHLVVVHHQDAQLRQRLGGGAGARQGAEHALGERDDDFGSGGTAPQPQAQTAAGRLREGARQREFDLAAAARLREPERRDEPLLRLDGQRRSRIPQGEHDRGTRLDRIDAQLARRRRLAQAAQSKVEQLGQHLAQLRHGAGDHGQIRRHVAQHLDAQLAEGGISLGEHAVHDHARVARLGGTDRVVGQFQEMRRDLGGTAHLAVQHHQGAGALRIEWAAMQQVGECTDRGETVVQRVEDVRGALVHDDVADLRWRGARRRGWGRWRGAPHGLAPLATEQVAEQYADGAAEAERDPQFHGP